MSTPIRLPGLGQSATEALLVEWRVAPGAPVRAGDVVAVVETDKAEVEVEAPVDGVLGPHAVAPGNAYPIGTLLSVVLADGEAAEPVPPQRPGHRTPASPKARRLARERGVDLEGVAGSGPGGLVVAADLDAAAAPAPTAGTPATWRGRTVRERRPLPSVQRAGARRTTEAWEAPHFVQMVDVDLTRLDALRRDWKVKDGPLAGVTWTTLVVAALARSLARHPHLNAAVDGDDLVVFDRVNVGVAVDSSRGLVVPVVADADRRSLPDLAAAVAAAAGTGTGDDAAGTATVSNLGAFGIRAGTAVLNGPESVLVFVGAVEERVVAVEGVPAVRIIATLSFAFDHRTTDGAAAARFVGDVRDRLERPDRYL